MAITTLDGVLAGMKPVESFLKVGATSEAIGVRRSFAYDTGLPGAIAAPAAGVAGEALTTLAGQIPFNNPVSGNTHLARFLATANIVGKIYLCDRLWQNSGIVVTTTTEQAINSVEWPARDSNGSVNGAGVFVAIEVRTATTNAAAVTNTTLNYTNSDGTAGKTAVITAFPATCVAGGFVPFQLAAGDIGIRSIQGITLGTSYGAGAIHLVAYRILCEVDLAIPYAGNSVDCITGGFVRLYDNTVPWIVFLPSATTATTINGQVVYTQG